VLILPFLGVTIVGLLMIYVIGQPVAAALSALTVWLKGMQTANAMILGAIIGAMMAFDMGGPVNKAAYTFATGLIASADNAVYGPMAASMVAGMTPPLAWRWPPGSSPIASPTTSATPAAPPSFSASPSSPKAPSPSRPRIRCA